MQYIAAPANAWADSTGPETLFFDEVKDAVDLTTPTTETLLNLQLRKMRTTLGQAGRVLTVAGQNQNVYYLAELARARYNNGNPGSLLSLCKPKADAGWSIHSSHQSLNGIINNTSYQIVSVVPPNLPSSYSVYFPRIGVRSAIPSSRTYAVYIGTIYRQSNETVNTGTASGGYAPPSSPSGGTYAYGENNTMAISNGYSHISWPTSFSISDTGYGPQIAFTQATSIDARGLRIKQAVVESETLDLTMACTCFDGFLIKLKKGEDYDIEDNIVPGNIYEVDFKKTQKVLML